MWIDPTTEQVFETHSAIRAAFPGYSFPAEMTNDDVAFVGLEALRSVAPAAFDATTHKAVRLPPSTVDGEWLQAWEVVLLTAEELEVARRARVPASVAMRQARLALLGAGLLDDVEAAIAALPSPQKEAARIEWEYSQEVQRHNGFVSVLAPALGMTEAQTDALFIAAAGL